jgi:hypothetical protein
MEAAGSSEALVPSYQSTRCHIPEHCDVNIHQHENVKSLYRKRYLRLKMQNVNFTCETETFWHFPPFSLLVM